MKIKKPFLDIAHSFIFITTFWLAAGTGFAETNTIRIAFAPFSAPAGNLNLQHAAAAMPDLLTAAMSQDNHFQLVEREKINSVWSELNLTEAGLTSANTVAKLGRVLSCDWLVNGSLVQAGTNVQVWIKVIDTQSSVVLDLESLPYNPANFPATAADIGRFLAQARTRTGPHEYIALDTFEDRSVSSTREDWTPRLTALIEKHFLADGYGVVEREAVAPIFSEYQLQSAGMTADAKRVKLKPAFWVVSGNWKWFYDTQDKLSVTLDIQKMGGGEQMLSFTKPPAEMENAIVDAIQSALKDTGSVTADQALAAEQKLRNAHLDELSKGHGETYTPSRFPTETPPTSLTITDAYGNQRTVTVDPNFIAQRAGHAQEMMKTLQQAVLLDPADARAKFKAGLALYGGTDTPQSRQGEMILEEVANSGAPVYALRAKNWLADVRSGKISFHHDQFGNLEIVTKDNPASLPDSVTHPDAKQQAVLDAEVAKMNEIHDVFPRAENVVQMPEAMAFSDLNGSLTAYAMGGGVFSPNQASVVVGAGSYLYTLSTSGQGPDNDFDVVPLPMKMEHPITAIENTESDLWLGTDGGGLIRLPKGATSPIYYGEKDGFPMSSITALLERDNQLFIGFGKGQAGAFGILNPATGKFTGIMAQNGTLNSAVQLIRKESQADVFWVSSIRGLYRFQPDSGELTQALPSPDLPDYWAVGGLRTMTVDDDFVVTAVAQGGLAYCQLPSGKWSHFNLSTNQFENTATAVSFDSGHKGWLWVGVSGKIMVIDMYTRKLIGECKLYDIGTRPEVIFPDSPEGYLFLGSGIEGQAMYSGKEPASLGQTVATPPVTANPPEPITPPVTVAPPQPAAANPATDPFLRAMEIKRALQNEAMLHQPALQQDFSKFVPVKFQKDADGYAAIQVLHVQPNVFDFGDNKYYCGFQFTVPDWVDGDVNFMFFPAKTEAQKDFPTPDGSIVWNLIPQTGKLRQGESQYFNSMGACPSLQERYPYTDDFIETSLYQGYFKSTKTFAIWFCFRDKNMPDIAFAITIDSGRGQLEFGKLPLN